MLVSGQQAMLANELLLTQKNKNNIRWVKWGIWVSFAYCRGYWRYKGGIRTFLQQRYNFLSVVLVVKMGV